MGQPEAQQWRAARTVELGGLQHLDLAHANVLQGEDGLAGLLNDGLEGLGQPAECGQGAGEGAMNGESSATCNPHPPPSHVRCMDGTPRQGA